MAAARQVQGAAEQCEKWVDPERDDFYRRLVEGQPQLQSAAEAATEATEHFVAFLREELLPRAPERDGVGRETYAVTARAFLGDEVDLEETYLFGWQEIMTLTAEMSEIAKSLGADSAEEAAAALDAIRPGGSGRPSWSRGCATGSRTPSSPSTATTSTCPSSPGCLSATSRPPRPT